MSKRPPARAEDDGEQKAIKRKAVAGRSQSNQEPETSKRPKTGGSGHGGSSAQKTEDSGTCAAGSSGPRGISDKHHINAQNAIYAAERLSCSLDVTHSLNFMLCGEIRPSGSFAA